MNFWNRLIKNYYKEASRGNEYGRQEYLRIIESFVSLFAANKDAAAIVDFSNGYDIVSIDCLLAKLGKGYHPLSDENLSLLRVECANAAAYSFLLQKGHTFDKEQLFRKSILDASLFLLDIMSTTDYPAPDNDLNDRLAMELMEALGELLDCIYLAPQNAGNEHNIISYEQTVSVLWAAEEQSGFLINPQKCN
ncbi:MAG: hypothetical protein ACOX7H_03760 [Bacillota bacterium]